MNFTVTFIVPQTHAATWNSKSDVKHWPHWLFLPTVWWRYLHTSRENCGSSDSNNGLDPCFMFKVQGCCTACLCYLPYLPNSPQRAVTDILWIMNTSLCRRSRESYRNLSFSYCYTKLHWKSPVQWDHFLEHDCILVLVFWRNMTGDTGCDCSSQDCL